MFLLMDFGMLEGEWGELEPGRLLGRHADEVFMAVLVSGLSLAVATPAVYFGARLRGHEGF